MKNGKGILYFFDGEKYNGDWNNDEMHGNGKLNIKLGIYMYNEGSNYEGELRNNRRNGKGFYT